MLYSEYNMLPDTYMGGTTHSVDSISFETYERMFVCPRSIYKTDINQAAFLDNLIYKVRCICSIVRI